jgi:peptide deformylase
MADDPEILLYGDPRLRVRCRPVEQFDGVLSQLVDGMIAAMTHQNGIGLAAPQVGHDLRLIVARDRRGPLATVLPLVNPEIVFRSLERATFNEGCLSLPGITADVDRPARVRVCYQDLQGREQLLADDGLLARIVQHEADHLDGVLFVDHLGLVRRKLLAKKLRELARRAQPA